MFKCNEEARIDGVSDNREFWVPILLSESIESAAGTQPAMHLCNRNIVQGKG